MSATESSLDPFATPQADLTPAEPESWDETSVFSLKGRFGRVTYAAHTFGIYFLYMAAIAVVGAVAGYAGEESSAAAAMPIVMLLVVIAVAFVQAAFMVKRFHDMDRSGWWVLLMLVPIANLAVGLMALFSPGTAGENRFGPPRRTSRSHYVLMWLLVFILALSFAGAIVLPLLAEAR